MHKGSAGNRVRVFERKKKKAFSCCMALIPKIILEKNGRILIFVS